MVSSNTVLLDFDYTNRSSPFVIHLWDGNSFAARIRYPDVVARELNDFLCAEVILSGACDDYFTFAVTNELVMPAGGVDAAWLMLAFPDCTSHNPILEGIQSTVQGPTYQIWNWPIRYPFTTAPLIPPTPPGVTASIAMSMAGAGFGNFHIQSVTNLTSTNWVTLTNLSTDATGYFDANVAAAGDQRFYRVIGY